jgi:hypothetical protein
MAKSKKINASQKPIEQYEHKDKDIQSLIAKHN